MQLSFLDSFRAVPKDIPCDDEPWFPNSRLDSWDLSWGSMMIWDSMEV